MLCGEGESGFTWHDHTYVPEKTRVQRRVRVLNTRSDTRTLHTPN